ncbi:MAG: choice-of-anchor A family protein [Limisphaerales bacterium]
MNNKKTMKKAGLFVAALAIVPFHGNGQDVNALLSQWSVVTSDNLELVNDIQGSAYVGGDVTVPNSFNVATGSSSIPQSAVSLAVVGNIDNGGNLQVNGGSVVAGGTIDRTINMNSGGTYTQNDPAGLPASPVGAITAASQYWSTLTANSSTSVANNGQLDFNCQAGSSLAVFNISAATMFGSGYQGFTLIPATATGDVIINIEGSSVDWNNGSFFSEFNTPYWDSHVLFNFYDATSVTLSGLIGGYVVAPNANVTEGNNIDGGVMAKNLTVNSEVDLPAWDGDLPNVPVPETAAWPWFSSLGAVMLAAGSLGRQLHWFKK